jgi:hypothetical protein
MSDEIEFEALRVMVREAMTVARTCWRNWCLYAEMGHPPGSSPASRDALRYAEEHPWLKEKDEAGAG